MRGFANVSCADAFTDGLRHRCFNKHNAEVKRTVPPEQLLVYNVKQGWEPLCEFLGVPVPDEPFPHANEKERFQKMAQYRNIMGNTLIAVSVAAIAGLVALGIRRFR